MSSHSLLKRLFGLLVAFCLIFFPATSVNAVLDVGDEVPNYVRSQITGIDLHGQDERHLTSVYLMAKRFLLVEALYPKKHCSQYH